LGSEVFEQAREYGSAHREAGDVDPFLPAACMVYERPEAVESRDATSSGEAAVTASSLIHLVGAESDRGACRGDDLIEGAGSRAREKRGAGDTASDSQLRRFRRILDHLTHAPVQRLCGARSRCAKIDLHLGMGGNNLSGDSCVQGPDCHYRSLVPLAQVLKRNNERRQRSQRTRADVGPGRVCGFSASRDDKGANGTPPNHDSAAWPPRLETEADVRGLRAVLDPLAA